MGKVTVSKRLVLSLFERRLSGTRQYHLAQRAGFHPSELSKVIHGAVWVQRGDVRVIRLGQELGLRPKECFSEDDGELKPVA